MSEDRLYELAHQRIDQKNRRWMLWAIHFVAFLMYVGAFTAFSGIPRNVGGFMEQAWFAALVLHSVGLVLTQDEEDGIAGEVGKVRKPINLTPADRANVQPSAGCPVRIAGQLPLSIGEGERKGYV